MATDSTIYRIRNEVCYWPNSAGASARAMDNAPWFDHSDEFDHRRIRAADIDGSGTTGIIYLAKDGVDIYQRVAIGGVTATPDSVSAVDNVAAVQVADLQGTVRVPGLVVAACRSCQPPDVRRSMGGQKPPKKSRSHNRCGNSHQYANPRFADKLAGGPGSRASRSRLRRRANGDVRPYQRNRFVALYVSIARLRRRQREFADSRWWSKRIRGVRCAERKHRAPVERMSTIVAHPLPRYALAVDTGAPRRERIADPSTDCWMTRSFQPD